MSVRILLVEDEPSIASFVEKGLQAHGYSTMRCADGHAAVALARDSSFELLVLDLGLPGEIDGLDVLRTIRARGERLPVVILTAREGIDHMVSGLEGGADDYITKPFRFEELLARVRARLRVAAAPQLDTMVLSGAGMRLDLRSRQAFIDDEEVELSAREFALAEAFLRHPGHVLSRKQLLELVWGFDSDPGSNVVEVYVGYLRRKLGTSVVRTVRGAGYRLGDG